MAKLDDDGRFLWAISAGGNDDDAGVAIATDSAGQSWITGHFSGSATFGSTALTSVGGSDIFVARVDASGRFLWAVSAGGPESDGAAGVSTDARGSCHVTGSFSGTAKFGSTTLSSSGHSDIFVARLDAGGSFRWAVAAGGAGDDSGSGIATDSQGYSYVTGGFEKTPTSGMMQSRFFVSKLGPDGGLLWTVAASGPAAARSDGASIALDGQANIHVTGTCTGTVTLGAITFDCPSDYFVQDSNAFVVKLDARGKVLWAALSAERFLVQTGDDIAVNGDSDSYVIGTSRSAMEFAEVDPGLFVSRWGSGGTYSWLAGQDVSSDVGISYGSGVGAGPRASAYITGSFAGTIFCLTSSHLLIYISLEA